MKIIKDIRYGAVFPTELDIYLPDADEFDVFIYFHGGAIKGGAKDDEYIVEFSTQLAESGIAVVSANYRLYPEASYPDFIEDAAEAVAYSVKNMSSHGKIKRFFVGGSSAGGYISMMLCFDSRYLAPYGIDPAQLGGFIHDAGQPTCHFNVLSERGIDSRRIIIDESAPLFHIGIAESYAPMLFLVADNDMKNRYEQTILVLSTLKHFGYDGGKISYRLMHSNHCEYNWLKDESGRNVFGNIIEEFIKTTL